MAISRYKKTGLVENSDPRYSQEYKSRFKNLKHLPHLETTILRYPTFDEMRRFEIINRSWTLGDRFYKLASEYYGDPSYWWVIAWFNKRPTEHHVKLGDLIKIPQPLSSVLTSFEE